MNITIEQLNQVANLIGTTDKNIVYSAVIKTLTDSGMALSEAFDALFGEGAYMKTAGDIYEALRSY